MFSNKGKRRAGPDNVRLRQEAEIRERRIVWYRTRLRSVGEDNRTLKGLAEIADGRREAAEGRLKAADELIERQAKALATRDARIGELEQLLKLDREATVEMPLPARPELVEAVA